MSNQGVVLNMDISFLPRLDPLSKFYSERYEVYLSYANKQKMFEWISDKFEEEISSQLVSKKLTDGKLSVLGIGSGDGKFEVKIIMQLVKKFRLIECTVVEPSAERITSYKDLVKDQKDALNGVTFDWRQETLQEFCRANADGSKKFHFVSAIDSLYYIPKDDLEYYMNDITRWTEGKVLIMLDTEESIFGHIEKEFSSAISALRPNFILGNTMMVSLKNLGINFETSVLLCELNVTSCFDDDSRDGKYLLDCFFGVAGLVDDGPPELVKMIREFLKSDGISYMRNGKLFVAHPSQVIITSTLKKN